MSKYKVGDKVVMEITDKVEVMEEPNYILSDATVVNQGYIDKAAEPLSTYIEQARAEGQNEAWELARKIYLPDGFEGFAPSELEEIFGGDNTDWIVGGHSYPEAAAKVEAWEKAKEEIKVGDEVEKNDLRDVRFIVTFTNGRLMSGVTQDGFVFANEKPKEWHKTGRHIDIDSFLKQIGEK